MSIYIIFENGKYDITQFICSHPGEGICNIFLQDYNNKDITDEIDRYHMSNEPYEILYKAKEKGSYQGILYVGENK